MDNSFAQIPACNCSGFLYRKFAPANADHRIDVLNLYYLPNDMQQQIHPLHHRQSQILVNDGESSRLFRYLEGINITPKNPYNLQAVALDSEKVELTWQSNNENALFRIYRGSDSFNMLLINEVRNKYYLDMRLTVDQKYLYQIGQLIADQEQFSNSVMVIPHQPATWDVTRVVSDHQLLITFSLPMSSSVADPLNYNLVELDEKPRSAPASQNLRDVLLSWNERIEFPQSATIEVMNLSDSSGTPIDTSFVETRL